MASKKSADTGDDLLAQLDDLAKPPRAPKSTTSRAGKKDNTSQAEQDLLAELGNLAQRPSTPSNRAAAAAAAAPGGRTSTATPPPGRSSEDKSATGQRKSADSNRSQQQTYTPATTTTDESPEPETTPTPPKAAESSGGGWWGGLVSTATAAVTQAQAAVTNLQGNDEAQKWTEQLKGNIASLRDYGGDLRSMALPTFQNILETLAPPITAHERLAIHITHDLKNYPSLDPTIHQMFSRVMAQVEGGDLLVVQRGNESGPKRSSKDGGRPVGSWTDGPWWRSEEPRDINAVKGLKEGSKLVRASAESFATDFLAAKGGVEQVARSAAEKISDNNPTRNSDIFMAIQAVLIPIDQELFASSTAEKEGQVKEASADEKDELVMLVYLHDPVHGIAFSGVSQSVPGQWIEWLDAPNGVEGALPESISDIIESGGVDPREWVSEWLEGLLSLTVGTVAQRYVARRMGVGEGGVGRGKGKLKADMNTQSMVESGGGEAARAMGGM